MKLLHIPNKYALKSQTSLVWKTKERNRSIYVINHNWKHILHGRKRKQIGSTNIRNSNGRPTKEIGSAYIINPKQVFGIPRKGIRFAYIINLALKSCIEDQGVE